jgi:hypothetical protein
LRRAYSQVTLNRLGGGAKSADHSPQRVERASDVGRLGRLPGHARICFAL